MGKVLYISIYDDMVKVTKGDRKGKSVYIDNYHTIDYNNFTYSKVKADDIKRISSELREQGLCGNRAMINICTSGIIVKTETYPKTSLKLLDKVIKNAIPDSMAAISIEDYEIRYKIIGINKDSYDVMIIAVPNTPIEKALELCRGLSLRVRAIDAIPNTILRMKDDININNTMVIDGGKEGTHLMIFRRGRLFNYAYVPCKNISKDSMDGLYTEIKGYLDYYASRNSGETIDNIVSVIGDESEMKDIARLLEERLSIKTNTYGADKHIINRKDIFNTRSDVVASEYLSNIGLMLHDKKYTIMEGVQ